MKSSGQLYAANQLHTRSSQSPLATLIYFSISQTLKSIPYTLTSTCVLSAVIHTNKNQTIDLAPEILARKMLTYE